MPVPLLRCGPHRSRRWPGRPSRGPLCRRPRSSARSRSGRCPHGYRRGGWSCPSSRMPPGRCRPPWADRPSSWGSPDRSHRSRPDCPEGPPAPAGPCLLIRLRLPDAGLIGKGIGHLLLDFEHLAPRPPPRSCSPPFRCCPLQWCDIGRQNSSRRPGSKTRSVLPYGKTPHFSNSLGHIHQQLADREVLGTCFFACSALNAVGRLALSVAGVDHVVIVSRSSSRSGRMSCIGCFGRHPTKAPRPRGSGMEMCLGHPATQ